MADTRKRHKYTAKPAQLLKLEASVPPIKLGTDAVDIDLRITLWTDPRNGESRLSLQAHVPKIKRRKRAG